MTNFPVLIEELNKAEKFIFMEYFIIGEGYVWDTVLDVLRKKVKEGVEVRLCMTEPAASAFCRMNIRSAQGIWNPVQGIWTDRTHPFYQSE